MAYNEALADRISQVLEELHIVYEEKKMFGGLSFMIDNKMCVGIITDDLMARIGPDPYENALTKEGVEEMKFTGRPLKGYVKVLSEAIDDYDELKYWIEMAVLYNPLAKASKKKKKKKKEKPI